MPRIAAATTTDYEPLYQELSGLPGCATAQDAAQMLVDALFNRFSESLVLLRLFVTMRYDRLMEPDRLFVNARGRDSGTSHLIHDATPIFTLLASRGTRPEWNDRTRSEHFRCIPLPSAAFVSSLSMLSRQFASVGLDTSCFDDWGQTVVVTGCADRFRGVLHIRDSAADTDGQGRKIVPRQQFVAEHRVKSSFGFGSGYPNHPTLVTLFAFTSEELGEQAMAPVPGLLEAFIAATGPLVGAGRYFKQPAQ
ncbi:hypothetical protein OR1_03101 [Geobacter sp. OR-1]|uniref:hypothetical protein n=1 Tax=Geobacter sp. OR-1 TaxID=1266765 RepID=UPI000541CC3F|nr:hypothetical protein [Geobacter sp. OR-1]GAM10804.1 hypothetical protein OR1_03101 [Geobacter sp. OR-1]